jgi:hypothetical protein
VGSDRIFWFAFAPISSPPSQIAEQVGGTTIDSGIGVAPPQSVSPGDFFARGNFRGNQTSQKYSNNRLLEIPRK